MRPGSSCHHAVVRMCSLTIRLRDADFPDAIEQDLELPPEAVVPEVAAGERVPFAAPTPGITPQNRWLQKCSLAAEHAAAGDFASAMRLLER